jgi:diaminopropionate ammonia-lyase
MSSPRTFLNPHRKPHTSLPSPNPNIRPFHQSLPHYAQTPLHSLPQLASDLNISHLLLKDESHRLGLPAFKILGASWATAQSILKRLSLSPQDVTPPGNEGISLDHLAQKAQEAGLVLFAATDGNHGRAVARMAKYLGISATIYVPSDLDEEAKDNIRSEGAEVLTFDGDYDETVLDTAEACSKYPNGKGLLICDTALEYGDEGCQWIVDGYQTMFDEVEEQLLSLDLPTTIDGGNITHVITPVGVGSLSQAVTTHFQRTSPSTKIIAIEPTQAACFQISLEAGEMVSVKTRFTICSGLCCGSVSYNAWEILRDGVTASVTVDDESVDGCVRVLRENGVMAGPCGAAVLAGMKEVVKCREDVGIDERSVVLLICTEGPRSYNLSHSV